MIIIINKIKMKNDINIININKTHIFFVLIFPVNFHMDLPWIWRKFDRKHFLPESD